MSRLLPRHRAAHYQWTEKYRDWVLPQWSNVIERDDLAYRMIVGEKGRFCQRNCSLSRRISNVLGRDHVWSLYPNYLYFENIIQSIIQHLHNDVEEHFIIQDDNVKPHRTERVQNMLQAVNIQRLNWPANLPDMNPIQDAWHYLSSRKSPCNSSGFD